MGGWTNDRAGRPEAVDAFAGVVSTTLDDDGTPGTPQPSGAPAPPPPDVHPVAAVPPPPVPDPFVVREEASGVDVAFDPDRLVVDRGPIPRSGWRRLLWRATGGRIAPRPDARERRARALVDRARQPLPGAVTIAVVSTKGGVGKTTTTLNLGHTLAATRGDRVVALDANPDAGSLGYRVRRETPLTALDLLAAVDDVATYPDVRRFTSQASSRLEVVASPDDPRLTRRLGRSEYLSLLGCLREHYNLVLADCGTGILDSATRGVVQSADQLVVVTGPSVDAARAVTFMLAWLGEHGAGHLVSRAVVVVNGVRDGRRPVRVDGIAAHFASLVRAVRVVPWDPELANGAEVDLGWLAEETRAAYLDVAGAIVEDVAHPTHPTPLQRAGGR